MRLSALGVRLGPLRWRSSHVPREFRPDAQDLLAVVAERPRLALYVVPHPLREFVRLGLGHDIGQVPSKRAEVALDVQSVPIGAHANGLSAGPSIFVFGPTRRSVDHARRSEA